MSSPARQGIIYGVLAYGSWGLIPLYFKLVAEVPPPEVLAERVVWSFVFLAAVVTLLGRWPDVRTALAVRRIQLTLCISTLLLSLNWFTFIYAVSTNQVVEASLGYFLNPLVNVLLGVVILKESLRPWQIVSIVLAAVGVAVLGAPLIAVALAVSFAFYGLLRKNAAVDGLVGLLIETVLLVPLALAYIAYLESSEGSLFAAGDWQLRGKLMASGIVTAVPLLLFTAAARRLRYSTLGFLQYLAPTLQFLLAVFLFHEELSTAKVVALAFIWTAVVVYAVDSLRSYRQQRREQLTATPADL